MRPKLKATRPHSTSRGTAGEQSGHDQSLSSQSGTGWQLSPGRPRYSTAQHSQMFSTFRGPQSEQSVPKGHALHVAGLQLAGSAQYAIDAAPSSQRPSFAYRPGWPGLLEQVSWQKVLVRARALRLASSGICIHCSPTRVIWSSSVAGAGTLDGVPSSDGLSPGAGSVPRSVSSTTTSAEDAA